MDKVKPVDCGCGGKPVVGYTGVWCNKCGIITDRYSNIEDAIKAWNKAMGDDNESVVSVWPDDDSIITYKQETTLIERRKGKWQHRKGSDCWECSQCHAVLENDDLGRHNFYFCYHCGANMMNKSGYMDIEEVYYE